MGIGEKSTKFSYVTWLIYRQFYFNSRRCIKRGIRIWVDLTLRISNMHGFQLPPAS